MESRGCGVIGEFQAAPLKSGQQENLVEGYFCPAFSQSQNNVLAACVLASS